MLEEWKDFPSLEEYFLISNLGNIFSKRTNKLIVPTITNKYYSLSTKVGGRSGKSFCVRIHRAVALAFIENPNKYSEINHIDGNKLNNKVTNLEWCSRQQNIDHAYSTGLMSNVYGEEVGTAKLTNKDVLEIKTLLVANPTISNAEISRKYNCGREAIRRIRNGTTWGHIIV